MTKNALSVRPGLETSDQIRLGLTVGPNEIEILISGSEGGPPKYLQESQSSNFLVYPYGSTQWRSSMDCII